MPSGDFCSVPTLRGQREIESIIRIITVNGLDCYVCGGYPRYMCSKASNVIKAGDVDIFCKDEDNFNKAVGIFRRESLNTHSIETGEAVTFSVVKKRDSRLYGTPKIQIIKPTVKKYKRNRGEMLDIIGGFDFTVIRIGLLSLSRAVADKRFNNDEEMNRLVIANAENPLVTLGRIMKYVKKGYDIKTSEFFKLFEKWEKYSGGDKQVMRELVDVIEGRNYATGVGNSVMSRPEELAQTASSPYEARAELNNV